MPFGPRSKRAERQDGFDSSSTMTDESIRPLKKTKKEGELYTRVPSVQEKLQKIVTAPFSQILDWCEIENDDDPDYVPSECLVYLVRSAGRDCSLEDHERLYKALLARVVHGLHRGEETIDLLVEEKGLDRFIDLIASDWNSYDDRLDFYEIRFNSAVTKLRIDARRQAVKEYKGKVSLEGNSEDGEISIEVETAAGSFDPLDPSHFDIENYRSRLNAAINLLPSEQKTIIEMLKAEIPIDSKDRTRKTISRVLGKSEKTIRTHRDEAFAFIKRALKLEDI
jgi:DNA-directed RNA polymerase specialized sigma24 family protein